MQRIFLFWMPAPSRLSRYLFLDFCYRGFSTYRLQVTFKPESLRRSLRLTGLEALPALVQSLLQEPLPFRPIYASQAV